MKLRKHLPQAVIKQHKHLRLQKLALAVALSFSATAPSISQAATYFVTNTNDVGIGSLRRAVDDANNLTPSLADTIEFTLPTGTTITLGSELNLTDSVTIKGPIVGDASSIILDGGGTNRHFNAGGFAFNSGQTIMLENITLKNGLFTTDHLLAGLGSGGGAIVVENADLTLNHVLITENVNTAIQNSGSGGGIKIEFGVVTINQSTISHNMTTGGGNPGTAHGGAGVYARSADVMLIQSTVSNNTTTGTNQTGGGLRVHFGFTTIIQSTISGNSSTGANGRGGGISISSRGATITQSTIVNNSSTIGAGGMTADLTTSSQNVTLINTILSENTGPEGNFENVNMPTDSLLKATNSLFGDLSAEITDPASSGNYISDVPDLGPLQHNGGVTQTHKPNTSSPVFDKGSNAEAAAFSHDQRGDGFPRIHNGTVDIGAVELQNNTLAGDPPLNTGEFLTRRDMARELLKAKHGVAFVPPVATGIIYDDVKVGDINADWIEKFSNDGYTTDCAINKFCPDAIVSREEIARIFLKVKLGLATPSPSMMFFSDVPPGSFRGAWITRLRDEGWTTGCDVDKYCPKEPVTREWFDTLLALFP